MEIIPAIIPQSFEDLKAKLFLFKGLVPAVQIDVTDGIFVPSKSWPFNDDAWSCGVHMEPSFMDEINFEFDLMVSNPEGCLQDLIDIGAKRIIVHVESSKKLEEIISARLGDIFELIEAHLKKIGRSGLLPAGVVLTGGGSSLATIDDLAKAALRLPARIANSLAVENGKSQIKDASWSVAYGLANMGLLETGQSLSFGMESARRAKNTVSEWFKQFLP